MEGYERLFVFPIDGENDCTSVGVELCRQSFRCIAPIIKKDYERNRSLVGFHDYHRPSSQIGIDRTL